jgi:hypothetical protein
MMEKLFRNWSFLLVFFLNLFIVSEVNAVIRIMPLGDSITVGSASGEENPDYMISYRKALWDLLVAGNYEVDYVGSQNHGWAVFGDADLADHEGHAGWSAYEIVNGRPDYGKLEDWLTAERPNIILLHVGTINLSASPADVKDILDVIDNHERNFGETVWVILARIINRNIYSATTTEFNDNVEVMARDRLNNPDNSAYRDKIIIVDMENGAQINYGLVTDNPPGDMWDNLHPFETGYEKMATVWFSGLKAILPVADAGPDQTVYEGDVVTLDASDSFDADDMIVSYFWEQQPGGPVVFISDATMVRATFIAPKIESTGESLTFKVTVTDTDGLESTDTTKVYVLEDLCPNDPNKTEPGICGCGVADIDTDGDGVPDCIDGCPNDPNKTEPGICGCGVADIDSDGDGTLDCLEQGPDGNDPNYDGNMDGVPDRLQGNVTSFHTYDKENYLTVESPPGTMLSNCTAVDDPSQRDKPSDVGFPFGFFNFTTDGIGIGGRTTVTLYFPEGETFDTYYVYGRTPDNGTYHWYEFLYDGETGAEINGNIIVLHFVDGMRGDDDLTANGIVTVTGGPGVAVKTSGGEGGGGGGGGCFIGSLIKE